MTNAYLFGVMAALLISGATPVKGARPKDAPTIEQAQFCIESSEKFAREAGVEPRIGGTFYRHFSVPYGRCFVRLRTTNVLTGIVSQKLYDSAERTQYAEFDYAGDEGHIKACWVRLPGRSRTQCKTWGQYEELIVPLMGTTIIH